MEIAFDSRFIPSVNALAPGDSHAVWKAVEKFQRDPDSRGLNFERLRGRAGRQRLHTIRASRPVRVLIACDGPTAVFLRAGSHGVIDRLAKGVAFAIPRAGAPGLIAIRRDTRDFDGSVLTHAQVRHPGETGEGRSILGHWTSAELADVGFDDEQIRRLHTATEDNLLEAWPDIDDEMLDRILRCSESTPDTWRQQELVTDEATEHDRFRHAIVERGALAGLSALLSPDEFRRLRSAPIEEWMIFLHPEQRNLVGRRFDGPALVRGAAGTGKTVVALHRAAVLARRFTGSSSSQGPRRPPVLFTTFIQSLPPVFESLYRKLPNAVDGAVHFVSVDALAQQVCREAGDPPRLNLEAANRAFSAACDSVVHNGSPLHRSGVTRRYLREELTRVLKGRGIDSLDAYQAAEVPGRHVPFSTAMREQVWRLRTEWDRRLAELGIEDFADVVLRALDFVRRRSKPTYQAAVVDESQDLTLAGLQLIRALVNGPADDDRPDALFLAGDGAQKLYPGGFTLAEAGLDVRGRSVTLRANYRNTPEIIRAALACAGSQRVDDFGERYLRGDAPWDTQRKGVKPMLVRVGDVRTQIDHVAEQIRELRRRSPYLGLGDFGVFAPSNDLVDLALSRFGDAALACQPLAEYDGRSNEAVKVGTFNRAKGLEFKVVFLLDLSLFPRHKRPADSVAEHDERTELHVGQLFVAMTRARDALFLLCNDGPSDVVSQAMEFLDDAGGRRP